MLKNYIFGLIASILLLPGAALAEQKQVIIKTIPTTASTCVNTRQSPVNVSKAPQNISITQRRVVRSSSGVRTEIYQSTTSSTSTTTNSVQTACVLPPMPINNIFIAP